MKRIICRLRGHQDIWVREQGVVARPGGILPSLDGYMTYVPDVTGKHRACLRCRRVEVAS